MPPTAEVVPINPAPNMEDWPYRFAVVKIKHLSIEAYQRPLTSFVREVEENFNPALVGCVCVSERSKTKYAVMDGQTRAEGMRRRGMEEVPAIVYYGLSLKEEARLFSLFQTQRRGMNAVDRFRSDVIAGDPDAVAILEVMEGLGFFPDATSPEPGAIRAMASIEYVFHGADRGAKAKEQQHPELLAETLEVIKLAWPRLPDTAKSAVMIKGLGYYLSERDPQLSHNIDKERLVARLQKISAPSELAARAEALRKGRGMSGSSPVYMAEAIEAQYKARSR